MLTINVPKVIVFVGMVCVNALVFTGFDCVQEAFAEARK